MSARCCQIRTGVLFLGFFLGTMELTLWVLFYTFRVGFRRAIGYEIKGEQDLIAATSILALDLTVNVLLICGANKDYSGRKKDLRRWGWMIPWVFVYGVNILAQFCVSIILFYSLLGGYKSLGLVPLFIGIFELLGNFCVIFFILEQRTDLEIYVMQQGRLPGAPGGPEDGGLTSGGEGADAGQPS